MIVAVLCFFMSLESKPAVGIYPARPFDGNLRQMHARHFCGNIADENNGIIASFDPIQTNPTKERD